MANKKFVVRLSSEERQQLDGLISKGKAAAKTILKARMAAGRSGSSPTRWSSAASSRPRTTTRSSGR